jgi:hypothetical protein
VVAEPIFPAPAASLAVLSVVLHSAGGVLNESQIAFFIASEVLDTLTDLPFKTKVGEP